MKILQFPNGWQVLVDDEDSELVAGYSWWISKNDRAVYVNGRKRKGGRNVVSMHRLIMNSTEGLDVDHINGSHVERVVDNQRSNLRICTKSRNMRNRQKVHKNNRIGLSGVSWRAAKSKWIARVYPQGRTIWIGSFNTPELAHIALCKWKQQNNYIGL